MSITFSGLATGMDTNSIVKDIMALERAPLDRIEKKKALASQRLEAFAQFKTKLDALKSAVGDMQLTSQLRSTKVSLSSESAFTATTTSGTAGSYNISVAQLSQVQKTITDGFTSNTEALLGTGSITVNGTQIAVNEDNNSLAGLMQSINAKADTTGVRASIINDGSGTPYHLVFTGKDASTSFTIASDLEDALSVPIPFATDDVQSAQQAVVFIDGIKVVSETNTLSTAISGVTLNLNAVSSTSHSGTPEAGDPWDWVDPPIYNSTRMDVEADTGALKEKITTFVTAYNDAIEWILSGYVEFGGSSEVAEVAEGSDEKAELGSVLRGDATINSMKRQLQNVLTGSIDNSGGFKILSEIGITTKRDGTLQQNNTKLDDALKNNFDNTVYLLSGDDTTGGVMKNFNALLLKMTSGTNGMYALQKNSYDKSVDRFDSQIGQMELRLTKREQVLKAQFTAMEQLVSSLNAQGNFLTQHIDSLNRDR
ncbi:MAG: flagellar hook-associated protein 2 [Desulfobulbaceae bacterium BRH_c16a]|nr:MAG: flagellar hook-associated protein 2 [Desulfobulbaceae bacterium BRH_c16a]